MEGNLGASGNSFGRIREASHAFVVLASPKILSGSKDFQSMKILHLQTICLNKMFILSVDKYEFPEGGGGTKQRGVVFSMLYQKHRRLHTRKKSLWPFCQSRRSI